MRPLQVQGGKRLAGMRWHKQTVMSGGVPLAVRDSGGDGIPAVLLHGLWGTPAILGSFGGLVAVEHAATRPACAGVVGVDGGLKIERPPVSWAQVQAQLDRPITRLLSRVVSAVGMGVRLSFTELQRVADEAAEREEQLEEAYHRLTRPMVLVLAGKADPVHQGEAMLAAADTAATRLQQRHPQVKLARLPCGHNIPLERQGNWPSSLSGSLNPRQLNSQHLVGGQH